MSRKIEIDTTFSHEMNISDYGPFKEIDGVVYPYIEVDYDEGYTCGRCSGNCPNNIPPTLRVYLVIYE